MRNSEAVVYGGCLVQIIILCICACIGAFLWPYSINSWLMFFGKDPIVVWWQGLLLGFCPGIGHITVPVAIFTWVVMLIL